MNAFNTLLSNQCNSVIKSRLCFLTVVVSALLMSPAIDPLQRVQAAIDETMPDSIPAEIVADWKDRDNIIDSSYTSTTSAIVKTLPAGYDIKFKAAAAGLSGEALYLLACHYRRVTRMNAHESDLENIMFARHHNFGGIIVGYHDNADQSNSDNEWTAKGALCVLNMKNYYSAHTELYTKTDAVIRDPCISFDGKKVLFAMSGPNKGTGYKIFEMNIDDQKSVKQLTTDPGIGANVADFEPCYLPGGDIMFTSTRNFGSLDCANNPTTNMFLMGNDGRYMHQVGFDQAHTFYPVLLDDGTVLYTRAEHNDRTVTGSMGLFVMNRDGCHQTEYFGNQLGWPFTIIHARPVPGTQKVIAVAGGFMAPYAGELMIIDHAKGYNDKQSIRMIAPLRETKPDTTKTSAAAGNVKFLFQTPYPLDEEHFIVSYRTSESEKKYQLYFMNVGGERELLAWADQSVSQPVVIRPRTIHPSVAKLADFRDTTGTITLQDVYLGEGMKGVKRGAAKSLRVVKLSYRVAGIGSGSGVQMNTAPSGVFTPAVFCPISAYGASWAAKNVLGEAKIYEDGSAAFTVPARTPVYFQVLDSMGYCIATMRSWSTLMPGERFACFGCHEDKNADYDPLRATLAGTPQNLDKPLGVENRPFDYRAVVQPIFDRHCVECHTADHESGFDLSGDLVSNASTKKVWTQSYNSLLKGIGATKSNKAINICTIFSPSSQQPPYSFGSCLSGIMTTGGMSGNHHDVQVTATERRIVASWIDLCAPFAGRYNNYMSESDSTKYAELEKKRIKWEEIEKKNIKDGYSPCACYVPGYGVDDRRTVKSFHTAAAQPARYATAGHALVLVNYSRGNLLLTDLRGRSVFRAELPDQPTGGNAAIQLPATLGAGIYVARFEGTGGTMQTTISFTK